MNIKLRWTSLVVFLILGMGVAFPQTTLQDGGFRYVSPGGLAYELRGLSGILGDRLKVPGKERLVMTGIIQTRNGEEEFSLIWEFPGKLRIEQGEEGNQKTIQFNGQRLLKSSQLQDSEAFVLAETFLQDTAEHLFMSTLLGLPVRHLGSGFPSPFASEQNASGPTYSIFQVSDRVTFRGEIKPKLYFFNEETRLLAQVAYRERRGKTEVAIEVRLGQWAEIDGQKVATRIERVEAGASIFVARLDSIEIVSAQEDGIF